MVTRILRSRISTADDNAVAILMGLGNGTYAPNVNSPVAVGRRPASVALADLFFSPALDGEGFKTNPRMCMACHGGKYNSTTHSVTDAQFLPFDVYYFQYSMEAGYTIDDQQEGFRKLNALVNQTNPEPEIAAFIDGLYQCRRHAEDRGRLR